jgi:outer membrane protein assembly factor BamB
VLVVDGVAYFAAGRQPLADGGILAFAVEPATGKTRWVERLDTVPTQNFYGCTGLEFDNFDLLHREGGGVAMSRWLFDRDSGEMAVKDREAFALLKPGGAGVVVPRGSWTYAPRHQPRHGGDRSTVRPLAVFRAGTLLACLHDLRTIYRRDFDIAGGEKFDRSWITGWAASTNFRKKEGEVWRSQRLAQKAKWRVPVFVNDAAEQKVAAMVLAADTLFLAGSEGGLTALAASDGKVVGRADLPAVIWDGVAAAGGRLFASTRDGRVLCLGKE